MITMALLVVFLFGVGLGWLSCRWQLRYQPPVLAPLARSGKSCAICLTDLGVDAVKTHDGKWRCAAHKSVP